MTSSPTTTFDAVIIGGGAAGLAAAVALARSLRSVLVVDAGSPRNAPAEGAHNVLGQEGISPLELVTKGRAEARGYGAHIRDGWVSGVRRPPGVEVAFEIDIATDDQPCETVTARRILFASGLVDELPEIPGLAEHWGTSVLHCPFCHGYEVAGKRLVVLATAAHAAHPILLFAQLSDDVTIVMQGSAESGVEFADEDRQRFDALGLRIVAQPATGIVAEAGTLSGVTLADGSTIPADAVIVTPRFSARTELFRSLGGEVADDGFGDYIPVDMGGRTAVPGVWAAGNASNVTAIVTASMSAGVMAGAQIHADLALTDANALAGLS